MALLSNKIILSLISLIVFISSPGFGSVDNIITVKGVLTKFDKNFIWLKESSENSTVVTKISRKSFPKLNGYLVGVAEIQVHITLAEFFTLNPNFR